MKKIITSQFYVLLIGTIFAWANLSYETYRYLSNLACDLGCSTAATPVNPLLTPCFYGAVFFLIAFIHSYLLFKKSK